MCSMIWWMKAGRLIAACAEQLRSIDGTVLAGYALLMELLPIQHFPQHTLLLRMNENLVNITMIFQCIACYLCVACFYVCMCFKFYV